MGDDEMIQVVIHPVLRKPFERWLADRNAHLVRLPFGAADDLPTYSISITTPRAPRPTPPTQSDLPEHWTKVRWMWPTADRAKIHAFAEREFMALCAASSNQRIKWRWDDGASVSDRHLREEHMREQMCKDCTRRALAIEEGLK